MLAGSNSPLKRIAIFYDGTFFMNTNYYYSYYHDRKSFIDFAGFHEYIRSKVAEFETDSKISLCQIVESHYFRGRFTLNTAKASNSLESDRMQDQLLMFAGIVPHYYPMNEKRNPPEEKGVDVWLALESYDLAIHNRFDVMVLFAGDQDYVPLIRKVNGLGTRVLVVDVDIEYEDKNGMNRYIKTSPFLSKEAPYTVMLSEDVNSENANDDHIISGIFRM